MIEYNKSKPLISIHVPKCGGSSFRDILRKWYGWRVFFHYYDEQFKMMPRQLIIDKGLFGIKLKNICIHGHFSKLRGMGIKVYYPEVKQFITILRDPYEIALSYYFYLHKRKKDGKLFNQSIATLTTLGLKDYISGYKSFTFNHFPVDITFDNYKDVINQNFIYIGITEDYQFTVNAIAEKLGFEAVVAKHENKSVRFEELSNKYREMFIEANQLEYEVYNYVKSNYKSKWINQSADLAKP